MPGSLDDRKVEFIDVSETLLTILVYPDGRIRLTSRAKTESGEIDHFWVVETLRRIMVAEMEELQ